MDKPMSKARIDHAQRRYIKKQAGVDAVSGASIPNSKQQRKNEHRSYDSRPYNRTLRKAGNLSARAVKAIAGAGKKRKK